jgi:hypothetical protein
MTIDKLISKTFYKQFYDKYNIDKIILKKIIIHEYLCNIYLDEDEETIYNLINFRNVLKNKIKYLCDENNKYSINLCNYEHQIEICDKKLLNLTTNCIQVGIVINKFIENDRYNINDIKSFSVMLTLYLEKDFLKLKNNAKKYYRKYDSYLENIFEEDVFYTNNDNRKPAKLISTMVSLETNIKYDEYDSEYESYYSDDKEESYVIVMIDLEYEFDKDTYLWNKLSKMLNMKDEQLKRKANLENNNIVKKNINFLKETFVEDIIKMIDDYGDLFEIYA